MNLCLFLFLKGFLNEILLLALFLEVSCLQQHCVNATGVGLRNHPFSDFADKEFREN